MRLLPLKRVMVMMNESSTYTYCGEAHHSVFGRYVIGSDYICVKDHSLLDTQILLIDEKGELHWEDYHNFQCSESPILVELTVRYHIDLCGDVRDYTYHIVWYKERTVEELKQEVIKDLQKRVKHQVEVINIREV